MGITTEDVIVGIDLGTTNYSVAIYNHNGLHMFQNEKQSLRTPCFLYFRSKNYVHVGVRAKELENRIKKRGLYDIKRFFGREYNDEKVQAVIPQMRYTVEEDLNKPVFVIDVPDGKIRKTPTEICSLFLSKIKFDVELGLGRKCNIKAVITVPTNFNKHQRRATLEAAELADIQVLELLFEPSAVALHYFYFFEKVEEGDVFLVYNLGGSNFNFTILQITDIDFITVAASYDIYLSGQNFDEVILSYLWNKLNKMYNFSNESNTDLKKLMGELRIKSEEIKIRLSTDTTLIYSYSYKSTTLAFTDVKIKITRKKFEKLAQHLLQITVDIVDQCLRRCNLRKSLIKKVFLGGGLTKIPKIQKLFRECFRETLHSLFIFEDTNMASGAALHAGRLSGMLHS